MLYVVGMEGVKGSTVSLWFYNHADWKCLNDSGSNKMQHAYFSAMKGWVAGIVDSKGSISAPINTD